MVGVSGRGVEGGVMVGVSGRGVMVGVSGRGVVERGDGGGEW